MDKWADPTLLTGMQIDESIRQQIKIIQQNKRVMVWPTYLAYTIILAYTITDNGQIRLS